MVKITLNTNMLRETNRENGKVADSSVIRSAFGRPAPDGCKAKAGVGFPTPAS
jgi:hypothetical protein